MHFLIVDHPPPSECYVLLSVQKVTKKFSEWKEAQVGMKLSKQAKQDGNNSTKLSHHPYILCHFSLCCVHRRVVKGTGCVVNVDVHGG